MKETMSSSAENSFEDLPAEEDEDEEETTNVSASSCTKAKEHATQLQRLKEKDPEFYKFLIDNDEDLLKFDDDDNAETDLDDAELQESPDFEMDHETSVEEKTQKPTKNVITSDMVDSWSESVRENSKLSAVRSLMRAFRTACHYGDDGQNESSTNFSIMSSNVFNKIMLFVLSEMDGVLRGLLKLPTSGGNREIIVNLMSTKPWKNHAHLVKSYLGNALHVLNQMTDTEMISFTLRRLRYSVVFLAAFPSLLRKYIKVSLHFWGTGGGALSVASFLFIRDLCIRLGSDCLDECFKGIYKAYVLNCQFVNAAKLQHIQFLGNCVIELYGVDLSTAYQHAFVFIRQLALILREALNMKTKEAFRKVYEWKFMNCLELWTGAICAYYFEGDLQPLAYPLTQIIYGVFCLVPTARYFPLRLRCAKMLNRIAASTGTYVPVSLPLLDMLEMKELNRPPTGGIGKAVDLRTVLKVSKPTLKTRAFQEACVFCVVEEFAEYLTQWSYSVAFFELAFIPVLRWRSFCKSTKVERFRREIRQLIRQVEANSEFTNTKRLAVTFLPNDPATASFLEVEKVGASPLSQYIVTLCQRARQRNDSMMESDVVVGGHSSMFGKKAQDSDEDGDYDDDDIGKDVQEGAIVFNSSWLPGNNAKTDEPEDEKKIKKKKNKEDRIARDEDVVEELVLSSDEDESMSDSSYVVRENEAEPATLKQVNKKRKASRESLKKRKSHTRQPERKKKPRIPIRST